MRRYLIGLSLAAALFPAPARAAEPTTFEELKSHLGKMLEEAHSYRLRLDIAMDFQGVSTGGSATVAGRGKEMFMEMTMDVPGQPSKTTMITGDDRVMKILVEAGGMTRAMTVDMAALEEFGTAMGIPLSVLISESTMVFGDPRGMLDQFGEFYDVTLAGKETLGGEDVYILRAVFKEEVLGWMREVPALAAQVGKMESGTTIYLGANDGLMRKMVIGDPESPYVTMSTKNLEINPALNDDLFLFSPREGVPVMDMTDLMLSALGSSPWSDE